MNKTIKVITLLQITVTIGLALWLVQLGERHSHNKHVESVRRKVKASVANVRLKAIERQGETLLAHSLRIVRKTFY